MAGEPIVAIIVQATDSLIPVNGRLAHVISYLAGNKRHLDLDACETGQLRVNWGSGFLKADIQKFLPSERDPGREGRD